MIIGPSFSVKGIEPAGVRKAPLDARQAFWAAVAGYVAEAYTANLAAGLDKDGNDFVPLRPKTIKYRRSAMGPADPNAPALQPAHGLSRTRSLFTVETLPAADGLACYWAFDAVTGDSWGEILDYHRQGAGALPVRDVFGLSPLSLGIVKRRAADWWTGYMLGDTMNIGANPMPTGKPGPTVFMPKGSGWGRATPLPGTGPRTQTQQKRINLGIKGIHYDLQGGLGFGTPPGPAPPPAFTNKTPMAPILPTITEVRKRAKAMPPAPAPTPTPVPAPVFARTAIAAARAVPEAIKYSESKVWIIDVYDSYVARGGLLSLEEFKVLLLEAHRAGLVTLGRFDLPGQLTAANRAKDAASAIRAGVAEFNFIRI